MGKLIDAALDQDLGDRFQNFIRQFQKDNVKSARRDMASAERFADLEADLGFLAMLSVAMLKLLSDKNLLEEGELMKRLEMADKLDGVEDGALSMATFRELVGAPRKKSSGEAASAKTMAAMRKPTNGKPPAPPLKLKGKPNAAKSLKPRGKRKK